MGLLHTKSVEIDQLAKTLADEQAKSAEYAARIQHLEALVAQSPTHQSSAPTDPGEQLAQTVDQWAADKLAWETQRTAFESSIGDLERSNASLKSDVTMFQEQYRQASDFVSTLQAENRDLDTRVSIAESQVRNGLAMTRGFFDERVRRLEADVTRYKGLCELLQERDSRTNDDVRRKAAEAEEVSARARKLLVENDKMEMYVEQLELEKERWERKEEGWEIQKAIWLKELELRRRDGQSQSLQSAMISAESSWDEQDRETVYRCMWMPRGEEECRFVGTSREVWLDFPLRFSVSVLTRFCRN